VKLNASRIKLKTPSELLSSWVRGKPVATEQYCVACGHVGPAQAEAKGRGDVELLLWATFLVVAVLYLIDYALWDAYPQVWVIRVSLKLLSLSGKALFMVSLVYTLFRLTTQQRVCALCHRSELVPPDSPRAKQAAGKS
jgi:hypothetical protein